MSVLASGSKTGLVTMICYLILRMLEYLFTTKKNLSSLVVYTILIIALTLIILYSLNELHTLIEYIASIIPGFSRIKYLFTNINIAISGNGSGRNYTWRVAIEIIKLSPILGVKRQII